MVERSAELAGIAARNIEENALSDRCRVVAGDLTGPLGQLGDLAQAAGTFDHLLANPPFYAYGDGTRAPDPLKDGSHAMEGGQLEAWARFAAAMTRPGGSFTVIHRPSALAELLACLDRRFGRLWILPLHPRESEPASRIIVQGIKASRAELRVLPGRVLHRPDGHGFTSQFDDILRRGAPLDLTLAG